MDQPPSAKETPPPAKETPPPAQIILSKDTVKRLIKDVR